MSYKETLKLIKKIVKIQMTRQDPRLRGLEESRDAKHTYGTKASTAEIDRPCYKNATSKEGFLWRIT